MASSKGVGLILRTITIDYKFVSASMPGKDDMMPETVSMIESAGAVADNRAPPAHDLARQDIGPPQAQIAANRNHRFDPPRCDDLVRSPAETCGQVLRGHSCI